MGQLVHVIETIAIALCRLFALGKIYGVLGLPRDYITNRIVGFHLCSSGCLKKRFRDTPEIPRS